MFGAKADIAVRDGPKQDGSSDCGLFAIATCVSLASNGTLPPKFEHSKGYCRYLRKNTISANNYETKS